jgi:hypothetical protein
MEAPSRGSPSAPAAPGVYGLKLVYGGVSSTGTLLVRADPLLKQ